MKISKQNNSSGCFVCGMDNPHSLKTKFYAIGADTVIAEFRTLDEHQSYPGVLHGGIAAAILDETMGRITLSGEAPQWGMTVELNMKYRKPLPTEDVIYAKAVMTEDSKRIFKCKGAIIMPDGKPAVTAEGRFMKLSIDQITTGGDFMSDWFYVEDKEAADLPEYVLNHPL